MILDDKLCLSDAQEVTADAGSTNYIDLLAASNIGKGEPLVVMFTVDTTFDTGSEGGTLDITLQTDDNTSFTSATTIATATQIAEATLVAGMTPVVLPIPTFYTGERYFRAYYNVNNSDPFTAGKINAYVMRAADVQDNI